MKIESVELKNKNGLSIQVLNYGAIISKFLVPDREGKHQNIVLGFERLDDYLTQNTAYYGAVVGRYANRIAKGVFNLDGVNYSLAINNGENTLHGGISGFDKKFWSMSVLTGGQAVELSYLSPDGEEGYPGNLNVKVRYTLTDQDELKVEYEATCDQATPLNLTQHSYFNLSGDSSRPIFDTELEIDSDSITELDSTLIPTGRLSDVSGTRFDFRKPRSINEHYDQNFVFKNKGNLLPPVAVATDAKSGIQLEVFTLEPGVQLYTGEFLPSGVHGFCLETQRFPNSPNIPSFPNSILRAGETYRSVTIYRVSYSTLSLFGSMKNETKVHGDILSTGDRWNADS